ncbi:hypothetical protein FHS85_001822 [Rhodoligotrophos appendicifer]
MEMGQAEQAIQMEGDVVLLDEADAAGLGEGGVAALGGAAGATAAGGVKMGGGEADQDLGIEAGGDLLIAAIEFGIADGLGDGEMGDVLAEITAMEINEAVGIGSPVEKGCGKDLGEGSVGAAGEAVVLPPMLPPLGNYLIGLFKETPLLAAITVIDVFGAANNIAGQTYRYNEPYTAAALILLAVSLIAAFGVNRLERYVGRSRRAKGEATVKIVKGPATI